MGKKILYLVSIIVFLLIIITQIVEIHHYIRILNYKFNPYILPHIAIILIVIIGSILIHKKYKGGIELNFIPFLGVIISQLFLMINDVIDLIFANTYLSIILIGLSIISLIGGIAIAMVYRRIIFTNYYKNKRI